MSLLQFGLAWLIGIAAARWLAVPLPVCAILAAPAVVILVLWRHDPLARRAAVCALALLAGGARVAADVQEPGADSLAFYNDQPGRASVVGVVAADPDVRGTYQSLLVRAEAVTLLATDAASQTHSVSGWMQVYTSRYPTRGYGDRLRLTGRVETPPVFDTFSYRDYLARQRIYSQMRYPRIVLLEANQGSPFWSILYGLRQRLGVTATHILPEPMAALLTAILLGVRGGIPKEVYDQFNATGTSHIIVISGSNIVIVCGLLLGLTSRTIGRRWAPFVTLVGVAGYTLLVGADAPVLRAAITGSLCVLALHFGRQAEARTSLVLAGVLMTAVNPAWLEDAGFQLSFTATAGLVWLVPPLQCAVNSWLDRPLAALRGLVSEGFLITLAAQVATLPVILYHFARVSPLSLITNMLILPVQPLIMFLGAAAVAVGSLWLPAGQVVGWFAWLPLAWTEMIVNRIASLLPFASYEGGEGAGWWGAGLGVLVVVMVLLITMRKGVPAPTALPRLPRLRTSTQLLLVSSGLAAVVAWSAVVSLPDGRLHVAFLDVGQGDAILITTPTGAQILVDGGPDPATLLAALGHHMPFWDRSLDVVINTHPDSDHLAGLLAVVDRYRVGLVIVPPVEIRSSLYAAWQMQLANADTAIIHAWAGSHLSTSDGVQIRVLHPNDVPAPAEGHPREERAELSLNNHSIVLYVAAGDVRFLLTGDIEADVERSLVQRYGDLPATVLKVPHHGSRTSSSSELLQATRPSVAVISVASDNTLELPAREVLSQYEQLGIPILRTDELGTIEFITDGARVWLSTDRQPLSTDQATSIAPPSILR
jgi:competence protein ComEC